MNASYKIVLLGAFVVFAAVVGYYIFSGSEKPDPNIDGAFASQDPTPTLPEPKPEVRPEPRPEPVADHRATLETIPRPVVPEPVVEPVEEATIGATHEELPEAPVIGHSADDDRLALTDPPIERERPAPEPIEGPDTTTDPGTTDRPAPEVVETTPDETTTGPGTEPEVVPEVVPLPRPVPPAPTTIPKTYTVKSGDTFASIAMAYYGEERAWFDIAQANPSVDPKRLQVGQVIVLPNRDATVREREEVQPPAPGKDQSYVVRPGDNLSKIASKFYGDSEKWDLIYARNRQLIGPRPDALKVGMELVIPQAYTGAE